MVIYFTHSVAYVLEKSLLCLISTTLSSRAAPRELLINSSMMLGVFFEYKTVSLHNNEMVSAPGVSSMWSCVAHKQFPHKTRGNWLCVCTYVQKLLGVYQRSKWSQLLEKKLRKSRVIVAPSQVKCKIHCHCSFLGFQSAHYNVWHGLLGGGYSIHSLWCNR